jgi:hypothetical protein
LPIITNSSEIPKEFNNSDFKPISNDGKKRLSNFIYPDNNNEFISNKDEILDKVFKTSLNCCERHFGKKKNVTFIHEYRRNGIDVSTNESSVFVNETLLNSLSHFITVVIYHSLDFNNHDVSHYCFKQLLFIMNEQCNNTYVLPNEDDYIEIIERYPNINTLNVSTDIYWGMIAFLILHEFSHIFLEHLVERKNQTIAEQENEADKEAYLIFLEMIYNKNIHHELDFLEEYIYLAPMMTIDFFTLVYYVDGTINGTRYKSYHPPHEERKNLLFNLFANWECDFDTENGNGIYNWYIDIIEKFKNDLFNANEQGTLKSIKRNKVTNMNEEDIVDFISEITDELTETDILNGYLDRTSVNDLINTHICFIADENKSDFVFMSLKNKTTKSFKLTNIIVNFKSMLNALLEIVLAANLPISSIEVIKFILFLIYKIFGLSTKSLSESAAQVILFLHQRNTYINYISEDEVIEQLIKQSSLTEETTRNAISELFKLRCIDIVNGNIILLEKIYLK